MWSLPTRSRPKSLQRFLEHYQITNAQSAVFVRLDEDDPFLQDYLNIDFPEQFHVRIGPRTGLKAAMEEMFIEFPDLEWYGLGADDLIPRTHYWDKQLIETAGLCEISYPNDLYVRKKNPNLPTHPVVGGDLVRKVGWFGHPATRHFFLDNAWQFIGESLGCLHRMEHVIVEHMHYTKNKSENDVTYSESNAFMSIDRKNFEEWQKINGESLLDRLRKSL